MGPLRRALRVAKYFRRSTRRRGIVSVSSRMRWLTIAPVLAAFMAPAAVLSQSPDDEVAPDNYSRKGADTCLSCHDDGATLAVFRSGHGTPGDTGTPFGHGELQCEACHGAGGDHAARVRRGQERPPVFAFGANAVASIAEQNALCMDCHSDDAASAWHGNGHSFNDVSCNDCHSSHTAQDPVLLTSSQADVCFDCHQQQRTQAMKPYAHPVRQGKMDCGSCHNSHGGHEQLTRQTVNDTCYGCHANTRGPYLWEHAPVPEDCGNCHDPHGSTQPGMLTMRAPQLCQSCHAQDGHPSLPQDERGLPSNSASQFLLGQSCMNCHDAVHGSNHPSGSKLMR